MKISLFANNTSTQPVETLTVDEFITGVRTGRWRSFVDPVRLAEPKNRKPLKLLAPAVTISGTFQKRNQQNLIQHSGFICIDIDHFDNLPAVIDDPYFYAAFRSISGTGIAGIVRIHPDRHKECFRWLRNYFYKQYGIAIDPAPSNVASMRSVSYDPDVAINYNSLLSNWEEDKPVKIQTIPAVISDDAISGIVDEVVQKGIDLAPTYDKYIQLAFSLADGFGELGREYFHALCRNNPKYSEKHADYQFKIALAKGTGGIKVGTFYFMLKEAGIQLPEKESRAVHLAAVAKKAKRKPEAVTDQLVQLEGLSQHQAKQIVEEVYARNDINLKVLAGEPEHLIESCLEWIRLNHPVKKNTITHKVICIENGATMSKEVMNTIFLRCRSAFNSPSVTHDLVERIIFSQYTPEFNPLKDFIYKHRDLKPEGNFEKLLNCFNTRTPYVRLALRRWLIQLHAAIDGEPCRLVLILVGKQLTGKTEFFRRLLPTELKGYYGESKLDRGKDDELLMCENLIIMDDEMGGKSKNDEKRFKDLTSKHTFDLRAPYGSSNEKFKRLAVLCGTSNDSEVINDPTGNTRMLPIEINEDFNFELYNSIDKTELFMELYHAYTAGESYAIGRDEFEQINVSTDRFKATEFEFEILTSLFRRPEEGDRPEHMTSTEIKNHIEIHTKHQIKSLNRLGQACRQMFGQPISTRVNGYPIRAYQLIKVKTEEQTRDFTQPVRESEQEWPNGIPSPDVTVSF